MLLATCLCLVCACAKEEDTETAQMSGQKATEGQMEETPQPTTGLAYETASDAEIDFEALREENPDIFAWLHIPGTEIDCPVLQSSEADDYYESHDAYGRENQNGAVYTELANLKNMCDFNTVLHGKMTEEGDFQELHRFSDPEFFDSHEQIYIYLEGNLLTYEVFAAYEREDTSLIRTYDFTYATGCQQFLDDLYGTRSMGKLIREGWEGISPYHFLITLTTQSGDDSDRQFVIVAVLVQDAAGTIDRVVE